MIFVAEIGSNHKGNKSLAYEMIRQASLAGADIVKFQLGHWKPANNAMHPQWMRYMPNEWVQDLALWCDKVGVEFMASIFSMDGLRLARSVDMKRYKMATEKAFKAHSRENQNTILKSMVNEGKTVFCSGRAHPPHKLIKPIYCRAEYPSYGFEMPPTWGHPWYGYSSHMHGYADALMAIAFGAKYIEKHVTLDKTEESIKDNSFALSFKEFEEMVKTGKEMAWLSE